FFSVLQADLKLEGEAAYESEAWRKYEAEFFSSLQADLKLEEEAAYESEAWRKYECERVYHIVSTQPDRNKSEAINAFFHAFRWRWGFAAEITQAFLQSSHERGSQANRELASNLSDIYNAYDQNEYQVGIEKLVFLERLNDLTLTSRCEIYALRGYLRRNAGNNDEALADFNRAIELDEKYRWAIVGRGITHRLVRKYEEALSDFNRAIELDEEDAQATANRGLIYHEMGKYEEALADFNRAIELDEKYVWAIANRGGTYQLMGKYEEALADFNRAIEL